MKKNFSIKNNILFLSSYSSIFLIVNVFYSYYALKVIGPKGIGLFQSFLLIKDIIIFLNIGEVEGLRKIIPNINLKQNKAFLFEIINDSFTISIYTVLATSILGFVLIITSISDLQSFLTALSVLLIFILTYLQFFAMNLTKGMNLFNILSNSYLVMIFAVIIGFFLIFFTGYIGFLIGKILLPLLSMLYLYLKIDFKLRLRKKIKNIKIIISNGLPLVAYSLLYAVFFNVGKSGIVFFHDDQTMGYYSLAILVVSPLNNLQQAIANVLFTTNIHSFRTNKKLLDIIKNPINQINLNFELLFPIVALISIALFVFIPLFLPKYIDGIIPSAILLFGYILLLSGVPLHNTLIIFNKMYKALIIFLVSIGLSFSFIFLFEHFNFGLSGIMGASIIGYFFFMFFTLKLIYKILQNKKEQIKLNFKNIYKYFTYSIIILLIEVFIFMNYNSITIVLYLILTIFVIIIFYKSYIRIFNIIFK